MKTSAPAPSKTPPAKLNVDIEFADHGQDFLRWKIRDSIVTDCQPFQGGIWCGMRVLNRRLRFGDFVRLAAAVNRPAMTVRYAVVRATKPTD